MEVFADQSINVTSTNNAILVEAQQKIVLQAGQSAIMLDGGNITFTCPGTFSVKGVAHQFSGGGRDAAVLSKLPDTTFKMFDQTITAINELTGEVIVGLPYKLVTESGSVYYGHTDEEGKTILISSSKSENVQVFWGVMAPNQSKNGGDNA
jgi:type VI secretion system secreted protein VgrG